MSQQKLDLATEFEQATAGQLCLERNRGEPSDKDIADAVAMCGRWNEQRISMELKAWK